MNLWGKTATALAAAIMLSGCGIPLTSEDLPPARPTETIGEPTPDASASTSASATATVGTTQDDAECVALDESMLKATNNVGSAGGGSVHFVSGQMVKATDNWWLVAAVSEIYDPVDRTLRGIDPEGLMVFATNAPSGGNNWVPLSSAAKWDGVTPTGEKVPGWRDYRQAAVTCARQA